MQEKVAHFEELQATLTQEVSQKEAEIQQAEKALMVRNKNWRNTKINQKNCWQNYAISMSI